MDGRKFIRKAEEHELASVDFGSGREVKNHFVCGFLTTAVRQHPLLVALPPVLVADVHGQPCAEWAETSFRYAAREHAARRPGSQDILGRLSELLSSRRCGNTSSVCRRTRPAGSRHCGTRHLPAP